MLPLPMQGGVSFFCRQKRKKEIHREDKKDELERQPQEQQNQCCDRAVVQERLRILGLPTTGVRGEVALSGKNFLSAVMKSMKSN